MAKTEKVVVAGVPTSLVETYAKLEQEIKDLTKAKGELRKLLLTYVPDALKDQPISLVLVGDSHQLLLSKPVNEVQFIDNDQLVKDTIATYLSKELFVQLAHFSVSDMRVALHKNTFDAITTIQKKERKFVLQPV
jgi:hypothetical protein